MKKSCKIKFNTPYVTGKEFYYLNKAIFDGQLSGDGPFTKKCNEWLEQNKCCKKALLTHSCTAALEMAAILIDIQPGDEVIMPSYTFVSTANAFVLRGGVPVFVDIRPDTLNLDENKIEAAITEKTKAIVPVHYAGVGCEMDRIMEIARKHNLYVIEDAAQGIMATYKDKPLGGIGHFGTMSFHETKNVISGEGGALLINDEKFIERAEIIREKGTNRSQFFRGEVDKYTWVDMGSSYLPGEFTAAFLLAQMEFAPEITERRLQIWNRYYENLKDCTEIKIPFIPEHTKHNAHMFYILLNRLEQRTELIKYLKEKSISSVFHYVPLHSSPAGKKYGKTSGNLDITDKISDTLLRLPLHMGLCDSEIDVITAKIKEFCKRGAIKC
ncbi:MAG: dTDP-4-amino-4,6-dideoxygalactose transaminase [Candidatus Melainabacteria bacterium GWF2_37_15]|nr:MAG: dTDP-4-amino-4,6-dideoxygalactose transaminase [Candidatus Melainabacteria bacterium GWF2_37_15]